MDELRKERQELEKQLKGSTFGYVSAALGLVAGLAWNEAIKSAIEVVFPLSQDTVLVKFVYAAVVTVVVVVLIRYIDKFVNRRREEVKNEVKP